MFAKFVVFYLVAVIVFSDNVTTIPEWVLLSYCGECRYCLALKGWDRPYFCILNEYDIPCYIRSEFFPDLTDGCVNQSSLESSSNCSLTSSSINSTSDGLVRSVDVVHLFVVINFLLLCVILIVLLCVLYKSYA
ncbi:hypothetical protein B9Z55_015514 [Caenorhabditis nigoni]|uniref:UPAR/Ly6 domain-containing protein n=1 Tax=Caenorhabditis nigoni TaxID=1611254 RepID=A0A2G5UAL4_9PELO|nr:hypothetical protein B9Z55_015514 [Caenorhabditis nigoni]